MKTAMKHGVIQSPADWRGHQMAERTDWIHRLTREELEDIEQALRTVRERAIPIQDIERDNFRLKLFPRIAERALGMLEKGPGMFLIRGLPVDKHPVEEMRLMYWGLGKYLGTAVTQSRKGDVLGDVRDLGIFNNGDRGRGYQSSRKLNFHTDSCDVVGLLVLRTAKNGGLSKIASSVAIHNEIARTRPDLLEPLYGTFYGYSPRERAGSYWKQPYFSVQDGHFSCKTGFVYFKLAAEQFPELPRLTPQQNEALELFDGVANREALHLTMMFEPGDLQLLNNHVCVHARTEFEDWPEEDRRRHLLRLWLSVPNSRPLSPAMADVYRDVSPGAVRGGYPGEPGKLVFESLVEELK